MNRDLTKVLRLLKKAQKDLQTAFEILEELKSKQMDKRSPQRCSSVDSLPEDPEIWQQKWKELVTAFEEQGIGAVEAFVKNHKRDYLIQFLRYNHIPMSKGKPSKRQIAEELVQRLREQRALKRSSFTRPPRSISKGGIDTDHGPSSGSGG